MKTDWLAVAQNIAKCARKKVAQDQERLDRILKSAGTDAQEQASGVSPSAYRASLTEPESRH